MAQTGLARAVYPTFSSEDGDVVVILASGDEPVDTGAVGIIAVEAVAAGIRHAVRRARSLGGLPDVTTPGVRSAEDLAWLAS